MADRAESADAEAARAEELKADGALVLELLGLNVEQFESVCRAVRQLDLAHAVDADGRLAVESPTPAQVDALRTSARHGRRDLDRAVLRRLRSRRGTKTIAVDVLTTAERDEVVAALSAAGHLAVVDDLDIVVERRGATAAERRIEGVIEGVDEAAGGSTPGSSSVRRGATDQDLPLAAYSRRLTGFVIDASAFLAVALVLSLLAGVVGTDPAFGLFVGVAAWFVTSTLLHARTGRTLGKTMAGTRLVDAETLGEVSLGRATLRGLVQFMPAVLAAGGIPVAVAVHGAILLLPNRQGLHDRLARTFVIDDSDDSDDGDDPTT